MSTIFQKIYAKDALGDKSDMEPSSKRVATKPVASLAVIHETKASTVLCKKFTDRRPFTPQNFQKGFTGCSTWRNCHPWEVGLTSSGCVHIKHYVCIYPNIYIYILYIYSICIYIHRYIYTYIHRYIYIYITMYIYIYIDIYIYITMYIYIEKTHKLFIYILYIYTYNNNNNNKENKLHKSLWEWEAPWHHIEGALVLKHGKERNAAGEKVCDHHH